MEAVTTDVRILPPGGEAMATEMHGKLENMITTPRGGMVSLEKHTVAPEEKTELPGVKPMESEQTTVTSDFN